MEAIHIKTRILQPLQMVRALEPFATPCIYGAVPCVYNMQIYVFTH